MAITTRSAHLRSAPPHADQHGCLLRPPDRALEDLANPAHVVLVVDDGGLESCPLLRPQRVAERPVRGPDARVQAQHLELVLGLPLQVLLAVALPHPRVRRHEDARARAVDARVPGALPARDAPATVELGGVLAVVPDVPARVLYVVVVRALTEVTGRVDAVVDNEAAHATHDLRPLRDLEDVALRLAVLHTLVDQRGARREREPRVVDL